MGGYLHTFLLHATEGPVAVSPESGGFAVPNAMVTERMRTHDDFC